MKERFNIMKENKFKASSFHIKLFWCLFFVLFGPQTPALANASKCVKTYTEQEHKDIVHDEAFLSALKEASPKLARAYSRIEQYKDDSIVSFVASKVMRGETFMEENIADSGVALDLYVLERASDLIVSIPLIQTAPIGQDRNSGPEIGLHRVVLGLLYGAELKLSKEPHLRRLIIKGQIVTNKMLNERMPLYGFQQDPSGFNLVIPVR
jgi:hypothetical protein